MFTRLSPESVHFRFFSPDPRAAACGAACAWPTSTTTGATRWSRIDGDEIVAVARYDGQPRRPERAEIAVTVEDAWQHRGVGQLLATQLAKRARSHGYHEFVATMLPDNRAALGLVRKLSPDATVNWAGGEYEASMPLFRAS